MRATWVLLACNHVKIIDCGKYRHFVDLAQFYSGSKSGEGMSTKTDRESPGAWGKIKYVGTLNSPFKFELSHLSLWRVLLPFSMSCAWWAWIALVRIFRCSPGDHEPEKWITRSKARPRWEWCYDMGFKAWIWSIFVRNRSLKASQSSQRIVKLYKRPSAIISKCRGGYSQSRRSRILSCRYQSYTTPIRKMLKPIIFIAKSRSDKVLDSSGICTSSRCWVVPLSSEVSVFRLILWLEFGTC
jgi:hypothetical protein